jgi:hypothetical protein
MLWVIEQLLNHKLVFKNECNHERIGKIEFGTLTNVIAAAIHVGLTLTRQTC